jgi:O-acetyl-ADP-ribose deacetylase (regulator of RNase III)
MEILKVKNAVIELKQGDITESGTDAIVNAANSRLILGGGVAGAIRKKGGPAIQAECDKIGGTPIGTAVITTGGNLKAKHVIHAVGPRMGEGDEDNKLKNATLNSLKLLDQHNLKSIAFPAISTGIFGYPIDRCAKIMISAAKNYLETQSTKIEKVIFVLFTEADYDVFQNELNNFG